MLTKAGDGIAIHAGLWTSAALGAVPDAIPVLRDRLRGNRIERNTAPGRGIDAVAFVGIAERDRELRLK